MFTLLAFLPELAPTYSLDKLSGELAGLFAGDGKLVVSRSTLPIVNWEYLIFRWSDWIFTVHLENHAQALEDAAFIQNLLGNVFPKPPVAWIRVVFGSDPSKDFTNHIIHVSEYLSALPGAVVYDPTQQKLW